MTSVALISLADLHDLHSVAEADLNSPDVLLNHCVRLDPLQQDRNRQQSWVSSREEQEENSSTPPAAGTQLCSPHVVPTEPTEEPSAAAGLSDMLTSRFD